MRRQFKLVSLTIVFATLGLGVTPLLAQQNCKDQVTAAGGARPTEGWAKAVTTNMWRRQVQAQYGEHYEDIKYAVEKNYICSPSLPFGRRCTLTAIPCRVPGTLKESEADKDYPMRPYRDATSDLQRELQRVGCYGGAVDGIWGDQSRLALERFARAMSIDLRTDEPTRLALKAAEEAPDRRICR